MKKITVIVPSRGRPENADRLARAFDDYASLGSTQLLIGADQDDDALSGYLDLQLAGRWVEVNPRMRMVGTLNYLAVKVAGDCDVIGFLGDDHLPRTAGFDQRISQEMTPGGIVYGNDLIQGPNLPTAVFIDAAVVRELGYMAPGFFVHLFIDNVWKAWGEAAGTLKYLDDVVIEHLHPIAGKTEWDPGYVEVNDGGLFAADQNRFEEYRASSLFERDVEIIRSLR